MPVRRLILRFTLALFLPVTLLGLLLPTPSLALTASNVSILGVDGTCNVTVRYDRAYTHNDGSLYNDGILDDFYRIVITDNTSHVTAVIDYYTTSTDPAATKVKTFQMSAPSVGSTSLTATIYDQTTYLSGANGTPLANSLAFSISSNVCSGGSAANSGGANTVQNQPLTYYPPENRRLAYIRVNTPIYAGPSLKSGTVGTLKAGQTWFVSVKDPTGMFWEVFLGGPSLGWIKASDIEVSGQSPAASGTGGTGTTNRPGVATVAPKTIIGVVLASHLAIHITGNSKSARVGTANLGERYTVLGRIAGSSWVKVTGPGGTGWVNSYYMFMTTVLHYVPVIAG